MQSISLLIMRLSFGLSMLFLHGWDKLMTYSQRSANFPDPLGVSPQVSLALAVFAEFFCAAFLALGLMTRLVALPLIVTMIVIVFIVHGADPIAKKELAVLYLAGYGALFFSGGGELSLSHALKDKLQSRNQLLDWLLK